MGTILTESDVFGGAVVHPNPQEIVSAAISMGAYRIRGTATPDGDLIASNATNANVRIRTLGGISMALSIIVVGNDITIQLATDGLGNPTSIANTVVALYAGTPAAVALASLVAGGAGTGICGIQSVYMRIGDDDVGSIRPMMQNIINRTRYLYNRVMGILFGTKTLKSVYVDGLGDNAIAYTAGSIFASNNLRTDNNVTAKNNVVALFGDVIALTKNVLAGDVIAANEVKGDHVQLSGLLTSATVPTSSQALGYGGACGVLSGAIVCDRALAPAVSIVAALNVASLTHPLPGQYIVTFNFNCSKAFVQASIYNAHTAVNISHNITAYSPLTVEIRLGFGIEGLGNGISVTAHAE